MTFTYVFAAIPVADLETAVDWYTRIVGASPGLLPNEREAAWQLTDTGWVYVVVDAARAGSGQVTVLVDDLDDLCVDLAKRGIATGAVKIIGDGVRHVTITDPDGNRFSIGQPPS